MKAEERSFVGLVAWYRADPLVSQRKERGLSNDALCYAAARLQVHSVEISCSTSIAAIPVSAITTAKLAS